MSSVSISARVSLSKCHSRAGWRYFDVITCWKWSAVKPVCVMGLLLTERVGKIVETHAVTLIRETIRVSNLHSVSWGNSDRTVTSHKRSWWVISHPVFGQQLWVSYFVWTATLTFESPGTLGSPICVACVKMSIFFLFSVSDVPPLQGFYLNMRSVCAAPPPSKSSRFSVSRAKCVCEPHFWLLVVNCVLLERNCVKWQTDRRKERNT